MNKNLFRVIWNQNTLTWGVAGELAQSRSKGSSRLGRKAFIALLIASGISVVQAETAATTVVPASGKTNAYISANGVPVVNIETANSAGLSHNRFTSYNVEANGLVLNNGNSSQINRQSQLAGQVAANANLVREAAVILNEVVSNNRSTLAGFTEVLGGRADVIVANPYGITCSGCGFINTHRATLTTGTPNIGIDGSLSGFTVNRGDVLFNGLGANASSQQIFDIVARTVKVNGNINVGTNGNLGITTGNNTWDYATRTVTGTVAGSGAAPTYAIDSTVLGGMYAGRINIIATEAGVGVRMLGEAAASADDFTLSSSGKIEIQSALSAERDVNITTTSASGTDDLLLNGAAAKVSAKNNLAFSASTGQVRLDKGELYAANDLMLTGATLSDASTAGNSRFAGNNNSLLISGAADIDGGTWGAGNALSGTFDGLSVGANGATLYAGTTLDLNTTNDLALANAAVRSVADMILAASTGKISTTASSAQGVQSTTGNLNLAAGNGLSNAGTMTADAGNVIARVSGTLSNSGTMHAGSTLDIADKTGGSTENVNNSGTLLADGVLTAKATSFTNQSGGGVQGTSGSTLTADTLTNAGTFVASNAAGQSGTFTLATLDNSGTIQSAEDLVLNVTDVLANTGKLLATHDLDINAGAAALAITNTNPGVMQAGNALTITGSNATFNTQSGTVLGNTTDITISRLENSGTLQSNADMTLAIGSELVNSGTLLSEAAMTLTTVDSLENSGTLQSNTDMTLTIGDWLRNSGTLLAQGSLIGNFGNLGIIGTGILQTNKGSTITTGILENNGTLITSNNVNYSGIINVEQFFNLGAIQSAQNLTVNASTSAFNFSGATILSNQLDLNLTSLTNSGTIQGGATASTFDVTNTLDNSGTLTLANTSTGSGTITADTLVNSGTLQSQGAATFNIATLLNNSGSGSRLLTTGAMKVIGSDAAYTLNNDGQIQSGDLMNLAAQGGTLTVNNGGMISSAGSMTLNADTLTFVDTNSRIVAGGGTNITLATSFSNPGAVHSGDVLNFQAPSITNTSTGGFSALNTLDIRATTGDLDNYGALYAGLDLTAVAAVNFTNRSSGTIDSSGNITISAGSTFINNFTINATSNIAISSTTFKNEIAGGVPARIMSADSFEPRVQIKHCITIPVGGTFCDDSQAGADTIATTFALVPNPTLTETKYYSESGSRSESFATTLPAIRPQIIAQTGNLGITGFTNGYNTGGLLSANVGAMTISGTNDFVNDDLSLTTEALTRTYYEINTWDLFAPGPWLGPQADITTSVASTLSSEEAGIYANTLSITGVSLTNISSAYNNKGSITKPGPTTLTEAGGNETLSNAVTGTAAGAGVTGVTTASGAPAISFGGLVITLPTNPNGFFVISQNPASQFLVETNPLFAVGSAVVGSNYMLDKYGYDPDEIIKRLGDANYEAYLIRQQLISQTGNNIINGYGNEAEQMKRLMDQAFQENDIQGFSFGKALTAEQVANLGQDMVWMVETTVAGQKVLAPVVYLSSNTRDSILTGAVIAGNTVIMDVSSVTNTGGTISGADSLSITSQDDITNSSGTITGGDVALTSAEGSIVNETVVKGSGNSTNYETTIGKTAGITATNNLNMDADKDIVVLGAKVTAGGDAALSAGADITFDTIVNKTASTTGTDSASTETNIGSTLETGDNLSLTSGEDTTIAGSSATVGGDLDVDTGGSFNVTARQDKETTQTETTESGIGVGGGLYGTETTTVDDFQGTNVGSTLTVGGNAKIKSENEMTVQGSDVAIAGDADIEAKQGISILDGLDESTTTTNTETTTYLKMDNASSTEAGTSSSSDSDSVSDYASAEAVANAAANAEATSDLKLFEVTDSTTTEASNTSISSNFSVGGNLKAKTDGTLKIQGSNVESGGNIELDAENVEVLAGRNEDLSNTETTTTSVGLYSEGQAEASSSTDADANVGTLGTNASADASASAEASGTSTFGVQTENQSTIDYKLTNSSSTLKSGGDLSIKAEKDAVFVGANVESADDMSIDATNITNQAAQDIDIKTSVNTTNTVGIYVDADASADASAEGNAQAGAVTGVDGSVSASAEAEASAGLRYMDTSESSTEGSTTNTGNSFKAGGDFSRTATDTIVDQSTEVEAGGNIDQTARVIRDEAVHDETFSSSSSSSNDARVGVYAEAKVDAGADAGASSVGMQGADAGAGAEAGAGLKASYENTSSSSSSSDKTAVTSKFKAGGNINSTSEEATTLVGTEFESGGDVNIAAGSLDYQAAEDSSTSSSSSSEVSAEGKVAIYGSPGVKLDAEYASGDSSSASTTARAGSINAGGNLNIKTTGDATFEGTNLEAGNAASIDAGGDVNFQAARNTTTSTGSSANANVSISATAKDESAGAGGGYEQTDSSSSTAVVGSIKSGSGGTSIKSGGDTSFEGTQLSSEGNTAVDAGGNVNLKAAVSTTSDSSAGASAEIGMDKGGSPEGEIGGGFTDSGSTTSTVTSIQSDGAVSIKGSTITNQESELSSGAGDPVMDGDVVNTTAENSEYATGMDVRVKVGGGGDSKKGDSDSKSGDSSSNQLANKSSDSANSNSTSGNDSAASANPNSASSNDSAASTNPNPTSDDNSAKAADSSTSGSQDTKADEAVNPNSNTIGSEKTQTNESDNPDPNVPASKDEVAAPVDSNPNAAGSEETKADTSENPDPNAAGSGEAKADASDNPDPNTSSSEETKTDTSDNPDPNVTGSEEAKADTSENPDPNVAGSGEAKADTSENPDPNDGSSEEAKADTSDNPDPNAAGTEETKADTSENPDPNAGSSEEAKADTSDNPDPNAGSSEEAKADTSENPDPNVAGSGEAKADTSENPDPNVAGSGEAKADASENPDPNVAGSGEAKADDSENTDPNATGSEEAKADDSENTDPNATGSEETQTDESNDTDGTTAVVIGDNSLRAKNRADVAKGLVTETCVNVEVSPGIIECVSPQ